MRNNIYVVTLKLGTLHSIGIFSVEIQMVEHDSPLIVR